MRRLGILRHPLVLAGLALGLLGLLSLLPAGEGSEPGLAMLRLGLALLAILALALGAVPALKRLPTAGRKAESRLRCEEQLALDSRHRLALVSVDGRKLLLGLQSDGFVLLADLDAKEPIASQPADASEDTRSAGEDFERLLSRRQAS